MYQPFVPQILSLGSGETKVNKFICDGPDTIMYIIPS
jgi:hypothetical protein